MGRVPTWRSTCMCASIRSQARSAARRHPSHTVPVPREPKPRSYPARPWTLRRRATHLLFSSPSARRACDGRKKSGNRKRPGRGQLTPGQSTEVDEINYGPKPWGHGLINSLSSRKSGRGPRPGTMRHVLDSVGRLLGTTPSSPPSRSGVPNRARGGSLVWALARRMMLRAGIPRSLTRRGGGPPGTRSTKPTKR